MDYRITIAVTISYERDDPYLKLLLDSCNIPGGMEPPLKHILEEIKELGHNIQLSVEEI